MRAATPRHVGAVCHLCAVAPAQATSPAVLSRALTAQARRHARSNLAVRPSGIRWASASSSASTAASSSSSSDPSSSPSVRPTPTVNVPRDLTDPTQLAAVVEDSKNKFLSTDGIPAPQLTVAALQTCLKAAEALQPQIRRAEAQANNRTSSSRLVALGSTGRSVASQPAIDPKLRDSVSRISMAAYAIISHPNVEMTPEFLELYVVTQAALGRAESLPAVLEMFASKPKPVARNGEVQYVARNPNSAVRAVEPGVANMALQTAIDAKNLDAALGVIEASFSLPAFKRQKLIKHGTTPGLAVATLPFGVFGLASAYAAYWQNTMDVTTATGIGAAGISGYLFVTGSLGLIAKLSHKDQMKRVTWAPGTPLRYRWLREEERAALDKVALAWGFKEPWRHGEETGPEWEGLREYMGYRQMILDRVEFMEGMS